MPGAPDAIVLDEHCVAYRKDNPADERGVRGGWPRAHVLRNGGKPTPAAPPSPISSCSMRAPPISLLRRRASRMAVDRVPRHCRSPGGRERPPGPDHPQRRTAQGLRQEDSRCLECPPRGRPRGVRRAAAAAAADEVKVVWVNPQDEGEVGRGRARRRHLRGPGAAWREMRGDRGRPPAGQCRPDAAHARGRVRLGSAGDGLLWPFAAARVRARRRQPARLDT